MLRSILKRGGALLLATLLGCGGAAPAMMMEPPAPARYAADASGGEAKPADADGAADAGVMAGLAAGFRGAKDMRGADESVAMNNPAPAATGNGQSPPQSASDAFTQHGPMLIYTATLNLAVFQVADASKQVEVMAREVGGFLARRDDTSLVIRVPAAKFEDVIKRIEKLGDVLHRNVVAEDVTEQFMDAEVRLKNARAVRDRLQELLAKATKVDDSLAIEKELTRVGTEIETLEGKLKYLRDRVMFSTITISFQPKQSDTVKPSVRIPVEWLDQLGLGRLLTL